MAGFLTLNPGNAGPHFRVRPSSNPRYAFDTAGGATSSCVSCMMQRTRSRRLRQRRHDPTSSTTI
ncbi:hypothetical protein [uncultured Maritimibacter sp.]|uniref:hypothetical protein n=1 Tax=uncultured Maritimibacter sp. TaxID=991866 RepID=UPI0026321F59|nr:hypothetical protein [uncultured Maritimibacter sp.]